jgi:sortase A
MRLGKQLEIVLLVVGLGLLTAYAVVRIHGTVSSQAALLAFHESSASSQIRNEGALESAWPVDFKLWSQNRIAAYKFLLATKFDKPVAVLSIPKLRLEVPVFEGTDDATLNRGAGHIAGTAKPDEHGNIGIAAHRDGFFRSLKDIQLGDQINLATREQSATYVVDAIQIVSPDNIEVLRPESHPSLTLVTCYPFYYVGDAPQRYIVHASVTDSERPKLSASQSQLQKNKD